MAKSNRLLPNWSKPHQDYRKAFGLPLLVRLLAGWYRWSALPRFVMRKSVRPKWVVGMANHKAMQNHIGQIHACAMALLAETATGFVTAMNVPDSAVVLIKSLKVEL